MLTAVGGSASAQLVGAPFDNTRLQRLRGLKFLKPVPVVVIKPSEVRAFVERDLKADYSDDRLRADGIAGSMLGLYPPQFDLKSAILKQASSQFGGIYFDHLKKIVVMPGGSESYATIPVAWLSTWNGPFGNLFAHEVTHALQDQHFDLEKRHRQLRDDSDRQLSFSSVVEGDATLAAVAYTADKSNATIFDRLVANLDGWTRRINARAGEYHVAEGLTVPDVFAHMQGIRFVAEVYRRGGWPAVDALYGNPPISAQQIMHPQLYFDHRVPVQVNLAGYEVMFPAASLVHTDVFGELFLQIILKLNLPAGSDSAIAGRWAGDRLAILRQAGDITVVWMIVFTDAAGAQRFAAAYSSVMDRLHGSATPHAVNYRGNAVLCVAGNGLRAHPELPARVWQKTSFRAGS